MSNPRFLKAKLSQEGNIDTSILEDNLNYFPQVFTAH